MLKTSTLQFLKDLKKNNNKPWFDAHRKEYEAAKGNFTAFIDDIIKQFGKKDPAISQLLAKDCLFRINRDVRFSKDKSPYKTNFGASITAGGKKSPLAGYYFHLEPGQSFAGGGLWMPMPEQLNKVRQEIDYNFSDFKKMIQAKKFKDTYGELYAEEGQKLSRVPKGYEPDNPAAEYLKYKSFVAMGSVKEEELVSKDLTKKVVDAFAVLQPFIGFLNEGMVV